MNIVYVARHDAGGNDDEGAVSYALGQLGHHVLRVHEREARRFFHAPGGFTAGDLVLFNKWDDVETIGRIKTLKVFWYWDLVDFPSDPTLENRCRARREWMARTVPLVDLGFCTDGDWAARCVLSAPPVERKLVWLMQGADERVVGRGVPVKPIRGVNLCQQILFTGLRRSCGQGRWSWVQEMERRWGDKFGWIERGLHGRVLADAIAAAKVVVAPDAPVTDRYWSNRVYLTCGFGGLLFHPYCKYLEYGEFSYANLPMYRSRDELHDMVERVLSGDWPWKGADVLAAACLDETKARHLYRHRCERLIQTVKERLL